VKKLDNSSPFGLSHESMLLFNFLLNYFWLSPDPKVNAKWYCDQHCFKIHTEVISSVWDATLELAPWIDKLADEEGISRAYRSRIHARPGCKWHPLSSWNALCLGNCLTSLIAARCLLEEHESRTGCHHKVWKDWEFLWDKLGEISFSSVRWDHFFQEQFPGASPQNKLKKFAPIPSRDFGLGDFPGEAYMTEPPRCINTKLLAFENSKSSKGGFEGLTEAYQKYYKAKVHTIKGGMRYYHSRVPKWLASGDIKTR